MGKEQLLSMKKELQARYEAFQAKGLTLDMSRGKPEPAQLDLSNELLSLPIPNPVADGLDVRNYGGLDGIESGKKLFASLLGLKPQEIVVGGSSSLRMMFDAVSWAYLKGVCDGGTPWSQQGNIKFLALCPGYDRHFAVTEYFGIEMIVVENKEDGPDIDEIERLVASDASIKGMWCVPKYSNPQGFTYPDDTVRRLAKMKTAAPDFRIFWDDAYAVHHLNDTPDELLNIMDECKKYGAEDRAYIFSSTSKITLSGAGVAVIAGSEKNAAYFKKNLSFATIGPDKVNLLRHVLFLKDMEHIEAQMKKHAAIIAPKFHVTAAIFERELAGKGVCSYREPNGGYFISFNTWDGCAKRTVQLCKEAGVTLTGAGATYPYGKDPHDRNIRIAPTYPPIEELKLAVELFCICVQLASIEKLLGQ